MCPHEHRRPDQAQAPRDGPASGAEEATRSRRGWRWPSTRPCIFAIRRLCPASFRSFPAVCFCLGSFHRLCPYIHWRPRRFSCWLASRAGLPRSTPLFTTAFPAGHSRLRAGHPRRAPCRAAAPPTLARHLLRHHGFLFSISVSHTSTAKAIYSADKEGEGREGTWCCAA